jgi:heme A synthase
MTHYSTGLLVDPDAGFANGLSGDKKLPRSIASDGRRPVLFFHIMVHVVAFAFNVAACICMWDEYKELSQIKTGVTVATAMHGIGIICLIALAASEFKQLAFVVSVAFIYTFLLCGLLATVVMAAFTFHSDRTPTTPHWLYYVTILFQVLGFSMLTSNALNMAAHGDVAMDANVKDIKSVGQANAVFQ